MHATIKRYEVDCFGARFVVRKISEKGLDIQLKTVLDYERFAKYTLSRTFFLPSHFRELSVHEVHRLNLIKRPTFWRALAKVEKAEKK